MAVKLSFEDNTQIIRISGPLTLAESTAVKLKIQEKFGQGRSIFLFDLGEFALSEPNSVLSLKPIFQYCLDLKATYVYSGIPKDQAKVISIPGEPANACFSSRAEALQFSATLRAPSGLTAEEAAELERKTAALIARYEGFFRSSYRGSLDPSHLLEIYKTKPDKGILDSFMKAVKDFEIQQLEFPTFEKTSLQNLKPLSNLTLLRKSDLEPHELKSEISLTIEARRMLMTQISQAETDLVMVLNEGKEWQRKTAETKLESEKKISDYAKALDEKRQFLASLKK